MAKAETKTGMGLVTEVSDVQTTDKGRDFVVVHVGGKKEEHKFSCWDEDLFPQLTVGSSIQFKWTQPGKWKNIVSLESDGNGSQAGGNGQLTKDVLIVRQACLKAAASMINIIENEPTVKAADGITIAELFEEWVWRKKSTEPEPPEEGE